MISNYTELKASILKWLIKDNDDTYFTEDMLDDVIYLAEAELTRRLRVRQMRDQTTFDLTAGDPNYPLPNGFLETYIIYRTGASDEPNIEFMTASGFAERGLFTKTGTPSFFYINEDSFVFGAVPSSDVNITVDYYKSIPNLSDSQATNSILTNYPDLYLIACLKQAHGASQTDREAIYEQRLERLIDQTNKADKRNMTANKSRGRARGII
jgi:hypothetical protein